MQNRTKFGQKIGKTDFDVCKALDSAPHKGNLITLKENKCPDYIGNWLVSFFSDGKFVVEIEGTFSEEKNIHAGVPQGPLSPILFSLYINKIGFILEKHDLLFGLFAYDLTVWKIDDTLDVIKDTLQNAIYDIKNFFNEKGLKLNEKK
jgi:hypothetical protein